MRRRHDDHRVDFGGRYEAEQMNIVGRDQINVFDAGGIHAIQATSGVPKLFVVLGLVATYAGFAMFLYFVISFMLWVFQAMGEADPQNMPDFSSISDLAVPWLPLGIGLMFIGMAVAGLALAVGKPRGRE